MKPLSHTAGNKARPKWSTQPNPGIRASHKVERSDGSVSVDKTLGLHSRLKKKEELRNANRSIMKSARQKLKRQLEAEP